MQNQIKRVLTNLTEIGEALKIIKLWARRPQGLLDGHRGRKEIGTIEDNSSGKEREEKMGEH